MQIPLRISYVSLASHEQNPFLHIPFPHSTHFSPGVSVLDSAPFTLILSSNSCPQYYLRNNNNIIIHI